MKQKIRLTESQLRNIIKESVKEILGENIEEPSNFLSFVEVLDKCGWAYFNYQELGEYTRYTLEKLRNGCDVETLKKKLQSVIPDIKFGDAQYKYAPELKYITAIFKEN